MVAVDSRMVDMMEKERLNDEIQTGVYPVYRGFMEFLTFGEVPIELGEMLAKTATSTIWTIKNDANLLV